MSDIFLSYSREDQSTARRFAEGFEREGFSVWWDQTLRSGENYDQVTEAALRDAKAVVVLWSKHSVDSRWVRAEATQADRLGTLIPAMIEPCNRPIMFELKHTAELAHWKGEANDPAWRAFVNDVRAFTKRDSSPEVVAVAAAATASRPKSGGALFLVAIAALLLGAGIWWLSRDGNPVATAATREDTAVETAPVSLAVLPFINMSSDPEQEYFSDGLSEEILNQLAQVKDLKLTARTSSFSFKGKNEDVRGIGEKLGVANVLEGSVRKSGDKLRITAQLIDTRDGTHLWSQTFDRNLTDVFAVQDEISRAVAQALSIKLDVGEMARALGGTNSIEAYDKYLRARELDRRRGGRVDFLQGAQFYREAVAIDPNFIRAWTDLYNELDSSLVFVPDQAAATRAEMTKIIEHLEKQAPGDWRTHTARASRFMEQRKWREADAELAAARADGADLNASTINMEYIFLLNTGRLREALPRQERRRDADPLSLNASYAMQIMYFLAGREADAQAEYERSKKLEGNHGLSDGFTLRRLMVRANPDPAAMEAHVRSLGQGGPLSGPGTQRWLASLRNPQAGIANIRRGLEEPALQTASGMLNLASDADYFGESALALQALRKSYVDFQGTNVGMLWQPWKTPLRSDPAFKDLLRDIGLVDYFRASGNWGDFCGPVGADDFECH